MINVMKENMNEADFLEFKKDYEILFYNRLTSSWPKIFKYKDNRIYMKNFFVALRNPYDYLLYKETISNNKRITDSINNAIKNKEAYNIMLFYHYVTECYLSFMVEYILRSEIEDKRDIQVFQGYRLDNYYKADLYIKGKAYQIKNISFIESNYLIEERLDKYKEANNDLYFIFYRLEKDNIYFVSIEGSCVRHIDNISSFTTLLKNQENMSINEVINCF